MILTIVTFLIVLSILVLVHEGGHFWLAKRAGIRVEEFGLGYPPRAWAKKIGQTVYSINWLPLGGFVRLFGEEYTTTDLTTKTHQPGAFYAKSKRARVSVILAGVVANFLLAIVCFSIYYSLTGIPTPTDKVVLEGVAQDSPAQQAGLKAGQVIQAVDGVEIKTSDQLISMAAAKKGQELILTVDGQPVRVVPRVESPANEGPLGVLISNLEIKKYPIYQMIPLGIVEGFKEAFGWGKLILASLGKMVSDLVSFGKAPADIAGPVGLVQITGQVVQLGWLTVLQFMGILSVNLAIINVLPLPALDGGRLVFIGYEALTRRKPKPEFERWVNATGMALLLTLILVVTVGDVRRLLETTSWGETLRKLLPF